MNFFFFQILRLLSLPGRTLRPLPSRSLSVSPCPSLSLPILSPFPALALLRSSSPVPRSSFLPPSRSALWLSFRASLLPRGLEQGGPWNGILCSRPPPDSRGSGAQNGQRSKLVLQAPRKNDEKGQPKMKGDCWEMDSVGKGADGEGGVGDDEWGRSGKVCGGIGDGCRKG